MTKNSRPAEQEAVRTTIVGGRPPGCGQAVGAIPRGIEVLVKKAAVDPQFRQLLLEQRAAAAARIGLELDPAEKLMLTSVPAAQLEAIVARTKVSAQHRAVFLGTAAALMLATLGVALTGCGTGPSKGAQPDRPPAKEESSAKTTTLGIQPDRLPAKQENASDAPRGVQSDRPPATSSGTGIRPDRPGASSGQPANAGD